MRWLLLCVALSGLALGVLACGGTPVEVGSDCAIAGAGGEGGAGGAGGSCEE